MSDRKIDEEDVVMQDLGVGASERFQVKKHLANTLQGKINLAWDEENGCYVVVKQTFKHLVKAKRSRDGHPLHEDFLKELKIHSFLSSEKDSEDYGFVRCLGKWEDDSSYYMAMEHCAGGELFEFIRTAHTTGSLARFVQSCQRATQKMQTEPNSWLQKVKSFFQQLVRAVDWMHERGVCHLDLSLENTLIGDKQATTCKIIDFGLAQKFQGDDFNHQGRVGKTGYMAPEVFSGREYDARAADIWSLGVMAFMMAVGAPPFPSPEEHHTTFRFILQGKIQELLKHWKRLPLVDENFVDMLDKIFKPQDQRISMKDLKRHPFVELESELVVVGESDVVSVKQDEDVTMKDADKTTDSSDKRPLSPNGPSSESFDFKSTEAKEIRAALTAMTQEADLRNLLKRVSERITELKSHEVDAAHLQENEGMTANLKIKELERLNAVILKRLAQLR